MTSLQNIQDLIPSASVQVKHYFTQATKPNPVEYGLFVRYAYAGLAITASAINMLGYGITILSSIISSTLYWDFETLSADCKQNADHIFDSLRFVAMMTWYVALSLFPSSGVHIINQPAVTPYELRTEATALVLQSSAPMHFDLPEQQIEIEEKEFALFFDSTGFDPITDSNHLLGFLISKPDYVLIYSENNKAYLVPRDQLWIKEGVMKGTLTMHDLKPVDVESSLYDSVLHSSIVEEPTHESEPVQVEAPVPIVNLPTPPAPSSRPALFSIGRVVGYKHSHKEMKYRHILAHHYRAVTGLEGAPLYNSVDRSPNSPLKTKCLELYTILTEPSRYIDVRDQHKAFILALRKAAKLCKDNPVCQAWIDFLATQRFSQVKLYSYQRKLVESVAKEAFNAPLTMANFWERFESIYNAVKNIPVEQGLPKVVEWFQNGLGHLNYKDFLLDSNVPYIYGQLKKEGKVVTVLRHGTPIAHFEPLGVIYRLIWGQAGNVVPEVTADYSAFIDAAHRKQQNILHLVLENRDWKYHGDESSRVEARLALQSKPNFFPLAFRFDGEFVEPKNYQGKSFDEVKREFSEQMFGQNTGFHVPGKLQQTHFTKQHFAGFMDSVQATFFQGQERLETREEFQAFVTLTYAEAALALCDALNVTYLEAHCKDDIDRGGAMKAIIVLLHLYKTGKFEAGKEQELQRALEDLMVNIVSAPLIVKKKPILKKRAEFIHNVINVMLKIIPQKPVPTIHYAGNFNVVSELIQELTPTGSTCRTMEEYQAFITGIQSNAIQFSYQEDKNFVALCSQNQTEAQIRKQLARDLNGLNMFFNNNLLDANSDVSIQTLITQVFAQLNNPWPVLATFTQTIGMDLTKILLEIFKNDFLKLNLLYDTNSMENDRSSGLYLTIDQGKAAIKFICWYKVQNTTSAEIAARVKATIEIRDHTAMGSVVSVQVLPPASDPRDV